MNALDQTYPHLDSGWRDAFMLELRTRGATGSRIGDLLAEADAHCAESGEDPTAAFGEPGDYARAIPLSPEESERATPTALLWAILPSLAGLIGLLLTGPTVVGWRTGERVEIPWGVVASCLVIIGVVAVIARAGARLVQHRWLAMAGFALAGTAAFALGSLAGPALHVPLWAAGAVVAACLITSVVFGRGDAEPVLDPLRGDAQPRATRFIAAATPWLFVVAALGMAILTAVSPLP